MARHRRPLAAVAAIAALAFGLLAAPPASAVPVNEQYPVAADGTIALEGAGWGHGVGMSQYGAQGGAERGQNAHQILAAYYPGTTLRPAPTRAIRVVLQRWDGARACSPTLPSATCIEVLTESGQTVTNLASGAQIPVPSTLNGAPVAALSVQPTSAGIQLWGRSNGWYLIGTTYTGPFDISSSDGVQNVRIAGVDRPYRGTIRVARASATQIHRINVLPMEDYLLGVVPSEMPAGWGTTAVQAQSVAARTYAAAAMASAGTEVYDICDTTFCQVYGGVGAENATATAKIRSASPSDVRGQVLTTSTGSPITAFFSSSNGGYSVSGGTSYLPARADGWDPVNRWTRTVAGSCLAARYPGRGAFTKLVVTARDGNGQYGGRVTSLRLEFAGGSVTIGPGATPMATDSAIRNSMTGCGDTAGLRSSLWRVTSSGSPPIDPETYPGALAPGRSIGSGGVLQPASGQHALRVDPVIDGQTRPGLTLTSRTCSNKHLVTSTGSNVLVMQTDGNLVLYATGSRPVWHAGTFNNPGAYALLAPSGNLAVYSSGGVRLWSAGSTCSQMSAYELPARYAATGTPQPAVLRPGDVLMSADGGSGLYMQTDGNLVYYRGGVARWASWTQGRSVMFAVLQGDGNLVVYAPTGAALYATMTVWPALPAGQTDETHLQVQGDRMTITQTVRNASTGAQISSSVRWTVS